MVPGSETTNVQDLAGDPLYRVNLYATVGFTVAAIIATAFPGPLRIPFAVLSTALFVVGTIAFLWAYGKALERSREEDVSVAMIYGMGVAPKPVRRRFHILTFVQSVVAITTAAIRPFTAQAFGILAIMLGIGLAGLWTAQHGTFAERTDGRIKARQQMVEKSRDNMADETRSE